ncbi:TIGR03899 family protein [Pseudoalteromonas citrea]|uniref:TIGR03899 family protein n=1 Tax=Pseudoalteromonas citrea TaxID=43655 RepID=A0A5S3XQ78_9GAMM|nr:TIGR03899 family protein [Pseudoalteromonas citrea]TMP40369.1 TIGR03899 family protein [Pseudoalteromonas citrea]TMP59538.1 TIGR03899 family protein [Pseudoalteromonas citrea]
MTVKNAQVKSSLALLIEEKLGVTMIKKVHRGVHTGSDDSYSAQGKAPIDYVVQSNDSPLKRALKRQQLTKIQRQLNIEAIMANALALCPDVTSRGRPDPDWLEHFIDLAEDIANQSMQKLWAKILVGETVSPGTFSIKSLQTLKQMTQREATALQKCAPLCGYLAKEDSYIILIGYYKKPSFFDLLRKGNKESINLSKAGLSFPNVLTLMDIGLLYRQEIESSNLKPEQPFSLSFQGKTLSLTAKSNDLVLSYYKLTQTGDELKKLITVPINKQYKGQLEQAFNEEFDCNWG